MRMNRAQLTITGIIIMFIELAIFAMIYPIQNSFIMNVTNDPSTNSMVAQMLPLAPFLEVIMIVLTPVLYSRVQQEPGI